VLDARLTALLCKKVIAAKSKEVKPDGIQIWQSSEEGYGSKRAFLPVMKMITIYWLKI
jgi:hypothetical protein